MEVLNKYLNQSSQPTPGNLHCCLAAFPPSPPLFFFLYCMEEIPDPPAGGAPVGIAQALPPVVFAHLQEDPEHADHLKFITCDAEVPVMAIFPDNALSFTAVPGKASMAWETAQLFFGSILATEDPEVRKANHERFYLTTTKLGEAASFIQGNLPLHQRSFRGELLAELCELGRAHRGDAQLMVESGANPPHFAALGEATNVNNKGAYATTSKVQDFLDENGMMHPVLLAHFFMAPRTPRNSCWGKDSHATKVAQLISKFLLLNNPALKAEFDDARAADQKTLMSDTVGSWWSSTQFNVTLLQLRGTFAETCVHRMAEVRKRLRFIAEPTAREDILSDNIHLVASSAKTPTLALLTKQKRPPTADEVRTGLEKLQAATDIAGALTKTATLAALEAKTKPHQSLLADADKSLADKVDDLIRVLYQAQPSKAGGAPQSIGKANIRQLSEADRQELVTFSATPTVAELEAKLKLMLDASPPLIVEAHHAALRLRLLPITQVVMGYRPGELLPGAPQTARLGALISRINHYFTFEIAAENVGEGGTREVTPSSPYTTVAHARHTPPPRLNRPAGSERA